MFQFSLPAPRLFALTASVVTVVAFGLPGASRGQDLLTEEDQALKAAVARVAPSVVRIETVGGLEIVGQNLVGTGPTTGVVISEDGLIVSSAFNFVQKPTSILVTVAGAEKRLPAQIVARDTSRQIVLLKVQSKDPLPVPEAAPRQDLTVGQWTVAIGRTFLAEEVSMSAGVLSATHRIWGRAVQTDAKVSPANYGGPLVDIEGRVIGILVPMSPRGQNEVAGAEWYDSGIGFAAPFEEMVRRLDVWRQGEDLQSGVLGIGLKGNDVYAIPAEVASVRVKSPAAEIGLKAGDKIVEINGQEVTRQAQLKHALGPLYAGDKVRVVVQRGDERKDLGETTLVSELVPYAAPYLGVLPRRESQPFVVRHVIPGSPAADAGLLPGDVLRKWNDQDTPTMDAVRDAAAGSEAGDEIALVVDRGGEKLDIKFTADALPEEVAEAPPAPALPDAPVVKTGVVEVKLAEAKNSCVAFVPENCRQGQPAGLLVWLHAPGKFEQDEVIGQWRDDLSERGVILLLPQSLDPKRWTAPEAEFITDAIADIQKNYTIDSQRIVVGGEGAGGAMAWLIGRQQRELIRGVAPIGAPVPRGGTPPESDPQQRLAFYITLTDQPQQSAQIRQVVEVLRKAKLPVTFEEDYQAFGEEQRSEIVRWLDTLDRL
ncbi:MAG: PDZ domain-containing protein [Planctomycetales bacterium]|nr:PDZ domain-containing protein [Planctomycetales bacterium]